MQPLVSENTRSRFVAQAAQLFAQFQRFNLTEQVRAGSDESHCAFIRRFDFFADEPPTNTEVLNSLFARTLEPELLLRDP